jgi:hypothetical protein
MNRLLISCLTFTLFGCTSATVIGTACKNDGDCNVSGQHCVAGYDDKKICTHTCSSETGANGCPIGYDCSVSSSQIGLTCNKAPYAADSTGTPLLFGKKCSLDDSVCQNTGDPNPMPMCRKGNKPFTTDPLDTDPLAFCTGTCMKDLNCPVGFKCATDYDGVQKCLKRSLCSECVIDADCPSEFPACVPTRDGSSRYCTKTCKDVNDCGGAQGQFLVCDNSTNVNGQAGLYCLHLAGRCVGDGHICDPCRADTDCTDAGAFCFEFPPTLERFCTKACSADADCSGPNDAACQPSSGICAGSNVKNNPYTITCY